MSLSNVNKKYWLLLVAAISIFFVFGYMIGRLLSWPEQIWHGQRYVLMDRYDLNAHYDLDNNLMGLAIYDISNDYNSIGMIDYYSSGSIKNLTRRTQDGFIRNFYYENGSIREVYKRNFSLGTSEKKIYTEDGNLIERIEKNITGNNSSMTLLKGRPPTSYFEFLHFEHSPWDIRANWVTANFKGHIYSYLSSTGPMICLLIMLAAVAVSCKIFLGKITLFTKFCTIIMCFLINLVAGFAMSWELFLFHRVQARADLLSDSSACGTVSLYIGVCLALACLILPLIISIFKSKRCAAA